MVAKGKKGQTHKVRKKKDLASIEVGKIKAGAKVGCQPKINPKSTNMSGNSQSIVPALLPINQWRAGWRRDPFVSSVLSL